MKFIQTYIGSLSIKREWYVEFKKLIDIEKIESKFFDKHKWLYYFRNNKQECTFYNGILQ